MPSPLLFLFTGTRSRVCGLVVMLMELLRFALPTSLYIYEPLCSADGSTHTESNKLYRKVKHRYRPNISSRQRPTAKARHDQAALAASAEARGATHRARALGVLLG